MLFRDGRIPKSEISINAERGWIYLRGQLSSPELIPIVAEQAAKIDFLQMQFARTREVHQGLHHPVEATDFTVDDVHVPESIGLGLG